MGEDKRKKVEEFFESDSMKEIMKKQFTLPMYHSYVAVSLFYLSVIMLPHALVARYPDCGVNPLDIYNKKLPVIQSSGDLIKIMNKTLSGIANIIEIMSSSRANMAKNPIKKNN